MIEDEKKKIAQRLSARVSTGIMFVEFEYLYRHDKPDPAWIRNIYILLSFYTELLLKAIFVVKENFSNKLEIEEKLRKMGHNLKKIGQQIGTDNLHQFGIQEISLINPDYLVITSDGNFRVEDFTDIRYDFIEGKVRNIPSDEHEMFRRQIKILGKINGILKPLIY
ncbi:MAG: hypothetical protein AAB455_00405 [Patescibacteria group bacterium]